MKLNYFDLISPETIYIQDVGNIIAPKLKDIAKISFDIYNTFLNFLGMTPNSYFEMTSQKEQYESLPDSEREKYNMFELVIHNESMLKIVNEAFHFFFIENIIYQPERKAFIAFALNDDTEPVGIINNSNYNLVCNIILQRNYINVDSVTSQSEVKNKRAAEILKKLEHGRSKKAKTSSPNENLEIGNIISAVANQHNNLNYINIWEITIYQLWDTFQRLATNNIYNIHAMGVAHHGDDNNVFDSSTWYKKLIKY